MPEILENRLMIRLGIVHLIVDDAFLCPRSIQARRHGIIRRRRVTRSVTEVVIAAEIMHPRSFKKILDLDIFGRARKFNHVFFELHAAASIPRAPIHPNIVAIVKNRRVNVQFHVVRSIVRDKRLPDGVFPRPGRMISHGNANCKTLTPILLDCPVMNGHVPVKLAIPVFAVARKSACVRPLERLDALPNKKAWDRRLADTEALVNLLRNKTERPTHRVRERPTCPCVILKIYQIFRTKNKSRKLKYFVCSEPFGSGLCRS